MSDNKISLKDFLDGKILEEKKKNKKKKTKKKSRKKGGLDDSWFTDSVPAASSGLSETLLHEIFMGMRGAAVPSAVSSNITQYSQLSKKSNDEEDGMTTYPSEERDPWEEEQEVKATKVDQARRIFQALYKRPDMTRADIINTFMKEVGVTNSTAVSYYTRFLEEFGLSGKEREQALGQGVQMSSGIQQPKPAKPPREELTPPIEDEKNQEEPIDPNRAGIIRTVKNAHLVYKRQAEDGTFEELWIYNIHTGTHDELDIRRDILAGTDIPIKKTRSPDGQQYYQITTMGNAQMMKIMGLPN